MHYSFKYNNLLLLKKPALGVSAFIVLSGFLNGYIYKNKYSKFNFKDLVTFTWKRIKKFYPLHILMLLITINYSGLFNYNSTISFINFTKRIIKNIFLIQSWWPYDYFSFNGVTWYLSVYMFLTFITIALLWLVNKIDKSKFSKLKLFILAIINLLGSFIVVYYVTKNNLNKEFLIYVFPPVRIFEYFISMIFGTFFQIK